MKKRIFVLILTLCLIYSSLAFAERNTVFNITPYDFDIFRNGDKLKLNSSAVLVDGQTYVPLRDLAEEMDLTVDWDGNDKKIMLTDAGHNVDEMILSRFGFDLPQTAKVLNYSYEEQGKEDCFAAKIFFEKSDLEYIQDKSADWLDWTKYYFSYDEFIEIKEVPIDEYMKSLQEKYDWWDISSSDGAKNAYFSFMEGYQVPKVPVLALICESRDPDGYYLYLAHY